MAFRQRILLVDDHPNFRRVLRSFLEANATWEVCGEASDGWEAVSRTNELEPDIVLMDLNMPKLNGLEAARRIHQSSPRVHILILTLYDFSELPGMAHEFGAEGVVLKTEPLEALTRAIEGLNHPSSRN